MSRSLVFGVGVNDLRSSHGCPFYDRWKGVLRRCYGDHASLSYEGCRISDEWISFSNFHKWMKDQPWRGNHLDKDILRPWEKLYCPETSVFVPQYINSLLGEKPSSASGLPVGVIKTKRGRPFMAMIRVMGSEKQFLGVFDSAAEAHSAWAEAKSNVIKEAVDRYRLTDRFDERICAALLSRAEHIKSAA